MNRYSRILTLTIVAAAVPARAYEQPVHQWMTEQAYDRSVLHDASFLSEMGFGPGRPNGALLPFDTSFLTPRSTIAQGAFHEDDGYKTGNHFFDPQLGGIGMSRADLVAGYFLIVHTSVKPSPVWALEEAGDETAQDYSLRDARRLFYEAVVEPGPRARSERFSHAFEALGHVVHHIQDMAQPQHVRDDAHFTTSNRWVDGQLGTLPSGYETYSLTRFQSEGLPTAWGGPAVVDLHVFDRARTFWDDANQRGLAQFTSENFISKDTNFVINGSALGPDFRHGLPLPVPCAGADLINYVQEPQLVPRPVVPLPTTAQLGFIGTPISDPYTESVTCNPRMSSLSAFGNELNLRVGGGRPAVNIYTYRAAHDFLIPRAIAYSAGMLDYFFRGRLAVDDVQVTSGAQGAQVRVVVRNVSAADFVLKDSLERDLEFEIVQMLPNSRTILPLIEGADLAGQTIAAGGTHVLRFALPPFDFSGDADEFTVVFRGLIGNEEGIILETVNLGDRGMLVTPSYTPADGVQGPRLITWSGLGPTLQPTAGLRAGNVDWKSTTGAVLTWDGPNSRYFFSGTQLGGISSSIYQDGHVLTHAPGNVLGAAIGYASGHGQLIAITYSEGTLEVYMRAYAPAYTNDAPYDPQQNPDGWRLIHSVAEAVPISPAFFNGSGTEGQLFVADGFRLKLHVAGTFVSVERINSRGQGTDEGKYTLVHERQPEAGCGSDGHVDEHVKLDEAHHVNWERETVVCADYRGDEEVLCQIDKEGAKQDHRQGQTFYWFDVLSTGSHIDARESTRRVLKASGLEIPLDGWTHVGIEDAMDSREGSWAYSRTSRGTDTNRYVKILYLDVRNSLASYTEQEDVRHFDQDGLLVGNNIETTINDFTVREFQHVVRGGGASHTLSHTSVELTRQPPSVVSVPLQFLPDCHAVFDYGPPEAEYDTPIDDQGYSFDSELHGLALSDTATQGFGVDGAGHVAISTPIVRYTPSGFEDTSETWNWTSGGTLEGAIPGAVTPASYWPIGVVR